MVLVRPRHTFTVDALFLELVLYIGLAGGRAVYGGDKDGEEPVPTVVRQLPTHKLENMPEFLPISPGY